MISWNTVLFSLQLLSGVALVLSKDEKKPPELLLFKENNVTTKGNIPIPDELDGDPTKIGQAIEYFFSHEPNCVRANLDKATDLFTSASYFPNVGSIFILHDRCGLSSDEYVAAILEALKLRGIWKNFNIFAISYPDFMCEFKDKVKDLVGMKTDFTDASKKLVSFLNNGITTGKIQLDQINFIGLGLGSQLAGDVARKLKQGNKMIKSIVGLNPTEFGGVQQVSKDDAQVVQLLHTYTKDYGTDARVGTADFVFNGAKTIQPLCEKKDHPKECSHRRSFKIFTAVIVFTSRFQAWQGCKSWEEFSQENSKCSTNDGYVFYPLDDTLKGTYYLRVRSSFPFGLGEDGRKFDKQTLDSQLKPNYQPKITKRKPKTG